LRTFSWYWKEPPTNALVIAVLVPVATAVLVTPRSMEVLWFWVVIRRFLISW